MVPFWVFLHQVALSEKKLRRNAYRDLWCFQLRRSLFYLKDHTFFWRETNTKGFPALSDSCRICFPNSEESLKLWYLRNCGIFPNRTTNNLFLFVVKIWRHHYLKIDYLNVVARIATKHVIKCGRTGTGGIIAGFFWASIFSVPE